MAEKTWPHPWPVQHVVVDERRLITVPWLLALQNTGKKAEEGGGAAAGDKATFGIGIGADQPVGDDLTNHYMVRLGGTFLEALANTKDDTHGELHIDIQKSPDEGATWASVFPAAGEIVIPANVTTQVQVTTFAASPNDGVAVDDWLRIDLMAGSAEDCRDIEVVIMWA